MHACIKSLVRFDQKCNNAVCTYHRIIHHNIDFVCYMAENQFAISSLQKWWTESAIQYFFCTGVRARSYFRSWLEYQLREENGKQKKRKENGIRFILSLIPKIKDFFRSLFLSLSASRVYICVKVGLCVWVWFRHYIHTYLQNYIPYSFFFSNSNK